MCVGQRYQLAQQLLLLVGEKHWGGILQAGGSSRYSVFQEAPLVLKFGLAFARSEQARRGLDRTGRLAHLAQGARQAIEVSAVRRPPAF